MNYRNKNDNPQIITKSNLNDHFQVHTKSVLNGQVSDYRMFQQIDDKITQIKLF